MEEIFDVVNERNEVIGQAPRSEVHRKGLLHRAVHVLVYNAAGQLFLQKRSLSKETDPGTWDSSAAGHVDAGESYETCAVREVGEELGVQLPEVPELILSLDACPQTGMEFVRVYRTFHEGPFVLHPEEIETGDWFSTAAIDQWILDRPAEIAPSLRHIWEHLPRY